MSNSISRRAFTALGAGVVLGTTAAQAVAGEAQSKPTDGPTEAPFKRDYPAPRFKPSWKRPQVNRLLVQDFVIYAHSDLAMVTKLQRRIAENEGSRRAKARS